MAARKKVIPRPARQHWRDIRLKFIPFLAYVTGVALVFFLWNKHWLPGTFMGEVQGPVANVASPLDGQLTRLSVQKFEQVSRGQILGVVALSPAAMSAGLAAIRADLMVLRARMAIDGQRNQLDQQQLRLDQLDQKVNLAIARSRLRFAENELRRQERLHAEGVASDFEYDLALDTRDSLAAEVSEREALIAAIDQALTEFQPGDPEDPNTRILETIDTAIQAEQENFRNLSESMLTAPIDGVVTMNYRNEGENVSAGEPLIVISGERPENILGFVRQPISVEPKVGDVVVVRSRRGNTRRAAEATVLAVGTRLEHFMQTVSTGNLNNLQDGALPVLDTTQTRGLPVLINIPQELALYPGEVVDISMKN